MSEVWIVFANDNSDEGIVGVYSSYGKAADEAAKYRRTHDLDDEDVWIDSYEVQ